MPKKKTRQSKPAARKFTKAQITKAIAQGERLIEKSKPHVNLPAFWRDIDKVMSLLKKHRPQHTHLVLHFVSVAVAEVIADRVAHTKMALLMALGMLDMEVQQKLMSFYCKEFLGMTTEQLVTHVLGGIFGAGLQTVAVLKPLDVNKKEPQKTIWN